MKYDDAKWHDDVDDFPKGFPYDSVGAHMGMFAAWAVLSGLSEGASYFMEDEIWPKEVQQLASRSITPGAFLMKVLSGIFLEVFLNDEGIAFVKAYFDVDNSNRYIEDYRHTFGTRDLPSIYHVKDTWKNFDLLKPVLDQRFAAWQQAKNKY